MDEDSVDLLSVPCLSQPRSDRVKPYLTGTHQGMARRLISNQLYKSKAKAPIFLFLSSVLQH